MDFDDLDEAEGVQDVQEELLALELRTILEDLKTPAPLKDFLEKEGLHTCLKFYDYASSADEVDQKVALQLSPPSTTAKEQVPIRNAWRRCKATADEERVEVEAARAELLRQEEAKQEAERKAKAERQAVEAKKRREEEEQRRIEAEKRAAEEKAERERKRIEAEKKAATEKLEREKREAELQAKKEAQELERRRNNLNVALQARAKARCEAEFAKDVPSWSWISIEQVMANHAKRAPGMFYGLEFPWTEALLLEFGPAWLTKAFHTAGTLPKDNTVLKIIPEAKEKVTTGNNGSKFLFEVEYKYRSDDLHTRLFAKIPHPMETKTRTDRLSTSVHKQPMEFEELNTSRLLEATLPVKIPKFYFADISNETSNFILIVERIDFADRIESLDFGRPKEKARPPLKPYELEGPYDKCIDWTLRGERSEYYYALVEVGAKMAGLYKAGEMGDIEVLSKHFENWAWRPIEEWGMDPNSCTGKTPKILKSELDMFYSFISDTAKVLFPPFVCDAAFKEKLLNTMLTLNAYMAENTWWRNRDPDYIALNHNNLNVDNAFFWRDEEGKLGVGLFDWGHMSARSVGYKLWPWLYCSDHEVLTEHMDGYLDCFVRTYQEHGGPPLDKEEIRVQFVLSAFEQLFGLVSAVPHVYRMCAKKHFATIKDRWDPRIAENIDGKSTLRLYLHVMESVLRIMQEWKGAEMVEKWVPSFCKLLGWAPKAPSLIWGGG